MKGSPALLPPSAARCVHRSKRIGEALRKRPADKRQEALRQVFKESEAVIEDFSSDEELAALIEIVRG